MSAGALPPYNIPDLPSADEILPYLRRMDAVRWYSNFGPLVTELEARLCRHLSAQEMDAHKQPVALTTMASCYLALVLGLETLHLPERATILMPAVTFPACPLAAYHARTSPLLADVDPVTWTLTPEIARAVVRKNEIHAVMPVAVYGVPVPVQAWDDFVRETGIPVIIDAAAAFDVQAIPDHCLVAFSLHGTKPFGAGEGGLLAGRDRDKINEARLLSNFGTVDRLTIRNGVNAKMSEYHAAVALAQLDRWKLVKGRRRGVFNLYLEALRADDVPVGFQPHIENSVISNLMIDVRDGNAVEVCEALKHAGVSAHRTYLPPLHAHPNFKGVRVVDRQGDICLSQDLMRKALHMPGADALARNIVGLPFHAFLEEADIDGIAIILREILRPQALANRSYV